MTSSHSLAELMNFYEQLQRQEWTGQVRVNMHKGDISRKVEKKESVKLKK